MVQGQYCTIFKMKKYREIKQNSKSLCTTDEFIGESIEIKVRRTMEAGTPVEAISPMVYTERKDGVRPDTNIRTDKWDIAQKAMGSIADGIRQKRTERMNAATAQPDASSK